MVRDKQQELQLTGANTIRKDRRKLDFYPTPANVTIALMKFLNLDRSTIWEPACGNGAMVKVLESFGHSVIGSDIATGTDFLSCQDPETFDAIITNPPFDLSEEFIKKSIRISPITCMLVKSQYWHARSRVSLFEQNPPSYILPLTWRPDFLEHERKQGDKKGSPTMEVLWTVWIRGNADCKYQLLHRP